MKFWRYFVCAGGMGLGLAAAASTAMADPAAPATPAPAPAAAAPSALSTPAMTPPLSLPSNPMSVDVGSAKIYYGGVATLVGLLQNNPMAGDHSSVFDYSNAQMYLEKSDGRFQFYVQGGGYSLPALATPYLRARDTVQDTYGLIPVAYVKYAPNANFNIMAGKLPTLVGAEYTFTFQNMNIERGLLWNQETAVSRGVQANFTKGPLAVSVSWNDGYYSARYSTGSTLVTWTINPQDTLAFDGSVNFSHTAHNNFVTPLVQNNGDIFNLMFTHTAGPFMIEPYVQYAHTGINPAIGIYDSSTSTGVAVLAKYAITPKFSLAGRVEYISTDNGGPASANILLGPSSSATSFTLTPTYQFGIYFVRAEFSYVKGRDITAGDGFGPDGLDRRQERGLIETGVLF